MSHMIGANPQELRELAQEFVQAGRRLATIQGRLGARIKSSTWCGPDAEQLRHHWARTYSPRMNAASAELARIQQLLVKNAQQQELTSAADGGDWFADAVRNAFDKVKPFEGLAGLIAWFRELPEEIAYQMDVRFFGVEEAERRRQLRAALEKFRLDFPQKFLELRRMSPAEIGTYWQGLTDDQRDVLISAEPRSLLMLQGIPDEVRAQAQQNIVRAMRGDLETARGAVDNGSKLEIGLVSAKWVRGESVSVLADGQRRYTYTSTDSIGVKVPLRDYIKGELRGAIANSTELVFRDEAEYSQFLEARQAELRKSDINLLDMFTPNPDDQRDRQMKRLMDQYYRNAAGSSVSYSLEGNVGASILGMSVGVGATGTLTANSDGTSILQTQIQAGGSADSARIIESLGFGPGITADSNMGVSLHLDANGTPSKIIISAETNGAITNSKNLVVFGSSEASTSSATVTAEYDLKDPAVRDNALNMVKGLVEGRPSRIANALVECGNLAEVHVVSLQGKTSDANIDIGVAGAYQRKSSEQVINRLYKPRGGVLQSVD